MKQKFTYLLSLMLMCILGASNATASSESDLATISANHTVIFAGIMNEAKLEKGKLYDSKYILSKDGNNYADNKGTNSTLNALNCCRVKSNTQDRLVFKVSEGCTLTLYGETRTDRKPFLNTDGSNTASIEGEFDGQGTAKYIIPDAGTYYIVGRGDFFLAGLQFTFPAKVPPTIDTDLPATKGGLRDETIVLSPSINDATAYQWYKCNDANKTGAAAITGATAQSYSFKATAPGTTYYYCVGSNVYGEVATTVCAVTIENAKWVSRAWDFTQASKWANAQAAASAIWGTADDNNRYQNQKALNKEELCGNDGPLDGLAGVYFTCGSKKLYLGGKDDKTKCTQFSGTVTVTIPDCNKGDKITLRYCGAGSTECTITSNQIEEGIAKTVTDRNNTDVVTVSTPGDVSLAMACSKGFRLYEIKLSSKYYFVTSFELSTDEVSVEEFSTVSVSGKNFLPTNASDRTLNWTSSDDKVATVNGGVITGVKAGTATITAKSVDGPSQTVAVTVTPCAPKNASIEMTSNSEAAAPKVESSKTYKLTAKAQGYDFTYQWASKTSEKGAWTNINGATDASYEETAVELGSKFYKVTITNAQGSTTAEYEVKTIAPLAAFTITEKDPETGKVTAINYKALDSDQPQVKVVYQETKAGEQTEVVIPASVEFAGLTYAVTNIGDEAYVNDNTVVSLATTKALKEIGARAFMFCTNLSEVSLVKGLEVIGDAAFRGCTSLTTFSIPSTVTSIGYKAFSDCDNLTDIYYDGTKDEWNALPNIEMAGISKTVTIHFKDGETVNGRGDFVGISNANADEAQKDGKIFKNGQIMIIKNGKVFNAAGAELK